MTLVAKTSEADPNQKFLRSGLNILSLFVSIIAKLFILASEPSWRQVFINF